MELRSSYNQEKDKRKWPCYIYPCFDTLDKEGWIVSDCVTCKWNINEGKQGKSPRNSHAWLTCCKAILINYTPL